MASGTRSVLISRWATGGKSSLALTHEYAANLRRLGDRAALRKSQEVTRALDLDYDKEPRVRAKKTDPIHKADHPYFWASHMLVGIPTVPMPDDMKAKLDAEGGDEEKAADAPADAIMKPGGGKPEGDNAADKDKANEENKEPRGLFANPKETKPGESGGG